MIHTEKTIYDPVSASDGKRILVMRLWPRGISKSKIDLWVKELGVAKETIHAWKEGKIEWEELKKEYLDSIKHEKEALDLLLEIAKKHQVTLLCSCKEEKHCHRHLLKQVLLEKLKKLSS